MKITSLFFFIIFSQFWASSVFGLAASQACRDVINGFLENFDLGKFYQPTNKNMNRTEDTILYQQIDLRRDLYVEEQDKFYQAIDNISKKYQAKYESAEAIQNIDTRNKYIEELEYQETKELEAIIQQQNDLMDRYVTEIRSFKGIGRGSFNTTEALFLKPKDRKIIPKFYRRSIFESEKGKVEAYQDENREINGFTVEQKVGNQIITTFYQLKDCSVTKVYNIVGSGDEWYAELIEDRSSTQLHDKDEPRVPFNPQNNPSLSR